MVNNIRKDERINVWFANKEFARKTRDAYAVYMQLFCDCINKTPSEIILESNIETRHGLFLSERKVVQYFAAFKTCLEDKKFSDKTKGLAISAVKSFFLFYDIQLSSQVGKNKRRYSQKENQTFLTRENVKKMLDNANTLRDRAIILCMATGGISKNELRNLKVKYLTFDDSGIGILSLRREKVHFDYTTFISPEAVEAVKIYFDERNRTPGLEIKGPNDYVFVTYRDGYRFKAGSRLGERMFSVIFRSLGEELDYINDAGWADSRSHLLRKYLSSTFENVGVPREKIDFMLGHVPSGVDRAYYYQDVNKLKELYIKHVEYLAINRELVARTIETADVKKLKQLEADKQIIELKLAEKDRELKTLQEQIEERDKKLDAMSHQFESRFSKMEELERKLSPFWHTLNKFEQDAADSDEREKLLRDALKKSSKKLKK